MGPETHHSIRKWRGGALGRAARPREGRTPLPHLPLFAEPAGRAALTRPAVLAYRVRSARGIEWSFDSAYRYKLTIRSRSGAPALSIGPRRRRRRRTHSLACQPFAGPARAA